MDKGLAALQENVGYPLMSYESVRDFWAAVLKLFRCPHSEFVCNSLFSELCHRDVFLGSILLVNMYARGVSMAVLFGRRRHRCVYSN